MYPINVTAESVEGPRSRGLAAAGVVFFLKWLLLLPHLIILGVLQYVIFIVAWVGFLIVLVTGKMPPGLQKFFGGYLRWNVRVYAWGGGITDAYPPFTFDPGDYDVDLTDDVQGEERSRGLALLGVLFFLKYILLIPHLIVLFFLFIAWYIVVWVGYVVVLFTGNMPDWCGNFQLGVTRWTSRVFAWFLGLVDEYPPFSLT